VQISIHVYERVLNGIFGIGMAGATRDQEPEQFVPIPRYQFVECGLRSMLRRVCQLFVCWPYQRRFQLIVQRVYDHVRHYHGAYRQYIVRHIDPGVCYHAFDVGIQI